MPHDSPSAANEATLVLIVDDNAFNRQGLRDYLILHRFTVIEAGDQRTAWERIQQARPRVAVIDLVIPETPDVRVRPHETRGILLAQQIRSFTPDTAIVLFSAYEDRGPEVAALIEQGSGGLAYLLKGCPAESLLNAIDMTLQGRIVIDPEVGQPSRLAQLFLARMDPLERSWVEEGLRRLEELSARERAIAEHVRNARNIKAIAHALNLAEQTIENSISRIYEKLGINCAARELRPLVLLVKILQLNDLLQTRL